MDSEPSVAYSIGHSSLSLETFLESLKRFDVALVVDVRRFPRSHRHPQFDRSALEIALASAGIRYLHLGDALGGYRDVPYETHMATDTFRKGMERLRAQLGPPLAFLCAEKHPWQCHRRFIAEELSKHGALVRHIVDGQLLL